MTRTHALSGTPYPSTCFRELSPVWLNYVAALHRRPTIAIDREFSYLELGSGMTLSTIVHAASFPHAEFHACDASRTCMGHAARQATELAIGNLRLHQASFDELLAQDLPQFDFIVLHGIYSWVDDVARQVIHRLLTTRLREGGLAYVSYNCLPGWAAEVPLRRMILELASSGAEPAHAVRLATRRLQQLCGAGCRYFHINPAARTAVDAYVRSEADYLAHEFLSEDWRVFYSIDVADQMADAGLEFVGSATLVDNHGSLLIEPSVTEVIAGLATARQRELALDFATNRQFRRDVFMRTGKSIAAADNLQHIAIGCPNDPASIRSTIDVPRGRIGFQPDFIAALARLMSRGPATMEEVARVLGADHNTKEVLRNILFLVAAGELAPFACAIDVLPSSGTNITIARMLHGIAASGEPGFVASPVVGGGVPVSPGEARMLIHHHEGGAIEQIPPALFTRFTHLGLL